MELRLLFLLWLMATMAASCSGYQNFTVGGDRGWTYDPSEKYNYSSWASGKNFTLGDYLIFKYGSPMYNVIQTYNQTVYKTCDFLNSNDDYLVWGDGSTDVRAAIPLVQTGPNYFFCGTNNSILCLNGALKFAILDVGQGAGLPPDLAGPPPPPPPTPLIPPPPQATGQPDNGAAAAPSNLHSPASLQLTSLFLLSLFCSSYFGSL